MAGNEIKPKPEGSTRNRAAEIKPGTSVIFRGRRFTVKAVRRHIGQYGTKRLQFNENLHTLELPEIASVTVVDSGVPE